MAATLLPGVLVADGFWARAMMDVVKAEGATQVPEMHILF
jgi:hypothetical protein